MNRKQRRAQEKTAGKLPAQAASAPVPAPEVQREANRFNDQALQAHALFIGLDFLGLNIDLAERP